MIVLSLYFLRPNTLRPHPCASSSLGGVLWDVCVLLHRSIQPLANSAFFIIGKYTVPGSIELVSTTLLWILYAEWAAPWFSEQLALKKAKCRNETTAHDIILEETEVLLWNHKWKTESWNKTVHIWAVFCQVKTHTGRNYLNNLIYNPAVCIMDISLTSGVLTKENAFWYTNLFPLSMEIAFVCI